MHGKMQCNSGKIRIFNICKRAYSANNIGVWEWDINKNEIFISEKVKEIIGCKFNSFKNMHEFISSIAYEKDKTLAIQDLDDYINGFTQFYESTFRIRTKNGEIKWVSSRGKIFKNEIGDCCFLSGIMLDVMEAKLLKGCDPLTMIPDVEVFFKKLNNSIKVNRACNKKGALIFIDIDNFKVINNNYGNYLGDLALKSFAQSINDLLGNYGELTRLSGDEFIILIYEFNDIKEIEDVCNKILKYLREPFKIMYTEIYVNISLGVTIFPDDSSDFDELLKFCNFAIYESKNNGKNMCTFFDKKMLKSYYRKVIIKNELTNSIVNNELNIFYQPQINALNNEVIGVEALLRWKNNKLGNVSPAEFIPIAESSGYIVQIGNWVLDKALSTACIWKKKRYKFNSISVNVSSIQLKQNDFKDNILNVCAKYNIAPSLLEIEITERTLMEIGGDRVQELNELMKSGVKIAIDDFGTGYSSLNYLIKLPITTLKIDKSIIDSIENYKNKVVINSIVNISKSLKFKIITEGVETKEQMNALTSLECNLIQGYFFSKPLPENKIENLFKKVS